MLQVQDDLAQASTALSDKTQAASALNVELEQLRHELSLKQKEGNQASASGAAAACHQAAVQQQRSGGEAQDQLGCIAITHPGQVSNSAFLLLY